MPDDLLLILVALASVAMRPYADAALIMMATLVSSIAALALADVSIRRLRPAALTTAIPEYAATTWRQVAVPLMIITGAEALLNRTGVVLLGWFRRNKRGRDLLSRLQYCFLGSLAPHRDQHSVCANDLNPIHTEGSSDAAGRL